MLFAPGGVVNLDDHRINGFTIVCKTVVKADRIKPVAEVGEIGQQPDGAGWTKSGFFLDEIVNCLPEVTVTDMPVTAKSCKRWPVG